MGRASIVSEVGKGQYVVELKPDNTDIEKQLEKLIAEMAALDIKISQADAAYVAAKGAFDAATALVNAEIARLEDVAEVAAARASLEAAETILADANQALEDAQYAVFALLVQKADLEDQLAAAEESGDEVLAEALRLALDEVEVALGVAKTILESAQSGARAARLFRDAAEKHLVAVRQKHGNTEKLLELSLAAAPLGYEMAKKKREWKQFKLERLAKDRCHTFLYNQKLVNYNSTIWCADYTRKLTGEVGTIEIDAEPGREGYIIHPGYQGKAAFDCTKHGVIQSPFSQSPCGAFMSFALKPAWQKWRPTFRKGTIADIDYTAGKCRVTLDGGNSSIQQLSINKATDLENVEFSYMGCDAAGFEKGDRVVVRFTEQNPDKPKVVGFVTHPRPCFMLKFAELAYTHPSGTTNQFVCYARNPDNDPDTGTDATEWPFFKTPGDIEVTIFGQPTVFADTSAGDDIEYRWRYDSGVGFPRDQYSFRMRYTKGYESYVLNTISLSSVSDSPTEFEEIPIVLKKGGQEWHTLTIKPAGLPATTGCFTQGVCKLWQPGTYVTECPPP